MLLPSSCPPSGMGASAQATVVVAFLHACLHTEQHLSVVLPPASCLPTSPALPAGCACQGDTLSLVQDLPIGKPCTSAEIDSLVAAKDVPVLCPWYLDLASTGPRLPAVVDKMKALSSVVQVAVCKVGPAAGTAAVVSAAAEYGVLLGVHGAAAPHWPSCAM